MDFSPRYYCCEQNHIQLVTIARVFRLMLLAAQQSSLPPPPIVELQPRLGLNDTRLRFARSRQIQDSWAILDINETKVLGVMGLGGWRSGV